MSQFTNEVNIANSPIDVNLVSPATVPISGTVTTTPSGTQDVNITSTITLPVSGTFFQATQPVSIAAPVSVTGPLTDTELRATPVPISGSVSTTPVVASSSTVTQVSSNGSNQTLLAANPSRRAAILLFESGIWSVKLGATASTSSKTYSVSASNTLIEIPEVYQGRVDAICTTSNKLVDVTELF